MLQTIFSCRRRVLSLWVLVAMMALLVGARARVEHRIARHRRQTALLATTMSSSPTTPLKVCVVGAGYAGLACAYHIQQLAARDRRPLELTIYGREANIGDIAVSSASAVSAGLLHPVSPRGKLMYAGVQAYDESVALLDAADTHLHRKPRDDGTADSRPLYQQTSLVRPCFRETDVVNWRKAAATNAAFVTMLADSAASTSPIPSPQPQATDASTGHEHDGNSAGSTGEGVEAALAYATVHGAYVVDSPRYLRALWALVNAQAAPSSDTTSPGPTASSPVSTDGGSDGGAPCRVSYHQRPLSAPGDLRALAAEHDVVVVATGAGSAPLWGPVNGEGPAEEGPLLPFTLVRGQNVELVRAVSSSTSGSVPLVPPPLAAPDAPLLAGEYLIPLQPNDGFAPNTQVLLGGGTHEHVAGAAALEAPPDAAKAYAQLRGKLLRLHPRLEGDGYVPAQARAAVRAVPPRTRLGRLPVVAVHPTVPRCYLLTAFGSRGLLYHAYTARLVAERAWRDVVMGTGGTEKEEDGELAAFMLDTRSAQAISSGDGAGGGEE